MALRRVVAFASALVLIALFAAADASCMEGASAPARRIVSLAPSITETLFALGAGPEVVGVSTYCDYPPAATKLPKVGSFLTPNVEAIVALRPTLVIGLAISSNQRETAALRSMGIGFAMVSEESLADIRDGITKIGAAVGRSKEATALVAQINSKIDQVSARLKDTNSPKVLMLVGHQPIVAVGRGTFLDDLLKLAHAVNIAGRASQQWPRLSIEYVIAMAPDVIIDGQMGTDSVSPVDFWQRYPTIPAVREHRVYGYDSDPTLRPGPRVWQSYEILASLIHPRAMGVTGDAPVAAR